MVHEGGYDDADRTHGALGTADSIRGPGVNGLIREQYLIGPFDEATTGPERRREICWPVLRLP